MCIIIFKPEGVELEESRLRFCWDNNQDGGGYGFVDEEQDELVIMKGYFNYEKFRDAVFQDMEDYPTSPFLIHMRIATHGKINQDNCHPFFVDNGEGANIIMAHNGVIGAINVPKDSDKSDTALFADLLDGLPPDWMQNRSIIKLILDFIGTGNKVVVLDRHKNNLIFNINHGTWKDGVWYSNSSYMEPRKRYVAPVGHAVSHLYPHNKPTTVATPEAFANPKSVFCMCCHILITDPEKLKGGRLCIDCLDRTEKYDFCLHEGETRTPLFLPAKGETERTLLD